MNTHHKFIDRTGEIHITNQGYEVEIIEYINNENCTVQFKNGFVSKKRRYVDVRKGEVGNPYHPSVWGIGYMGEGKYKTCINKKTTISYSRWQKIMERCYSLKKQLKNPTYVGCIVDLKWHDFQVFAEWFEETYNPETMQDWDLDKDILIRGSRTYSPETCCFVPHEINMLFAKSKGSRGEYPIGVSLYRATGQYVAQLQGEYLGLFNTIDEAFQAYKKAKEKKIKRLANKWRGQITEECYQVLINYRVQITD